MGSVIGQGGRIATIAVQIAGLAPEMACAIVVRIVTQTLLVALVLLAVMGAVKVEKTKVTALMIAAVLVAMALVIQPIMEA
jgi:hypothetical protein